MIKKFLKYFSIIAAPIFIMALSSLNEVFDMPEKMYFNENIQVADISFTQKNVFNTLEFTDEKIEMNFLGLIPVKSVSIEKVDDLRLNVGGTPVGIKLATEGVLVVGFSEIESNNGVKSVPAKEQGIQLGDVILTVNGQGINTSKELSSIIQSCNNEKVKMQILRDNTKLTKEIVAVKENNSLKVGLWVRDSTAGIGTLTFYHNESSCFGALGHPITDCDTNKIFMMRNGNLLDASIISVRKGEKGTPGELRGLFINENNSIGSINTNTKSGIYGESKNVLVNPMYTEPLPVGFRSEIVEGPATIITTIDDQGPKEYTIEIVKILPQDEPGPKSMILKITDEELLNKTGGIVQGMSGSPIIQNGKIIGAVTHVLINKPDLGYGIYIEWMLQDAGVIQ